MSNIDEYVKIIDFSSIIDFIIYFCFICIIINFIITLVMDFFFEKNDSKVEEETKTKLNIIELSGGICIVIIIILLFPLYVKFSKYISLLFIPSIILFFYAIYIKPMANNNSSAFKIDYYEYGAILTWALFYFNNIDYKKIFINISNEASLQIICILILLFEIYSCVYCLLLNLYFVIKNLKNIKIHVFIEKYNYLIEKIYNKLDFSKISLKFSFSNNLIISKDNPNAKKILLFLPSFVLDIIICFFKYFLSLFLSLVVKPLFTMLSFIFSKIIDLSNTNENQINYGMTKIISTFSIICVYIILQINDIFQERIINTYEFISSVIIIPIILETLLTLKGKVKKEVI